MNRAHCVIVRACSWLAGHPGAWIIGLAVAGMASAPSPAWGQWTFGSGGAIYYNGGNVGIGTSNPLAQMHLYKVPSGSAQPLVLLDSGTVGKARIGPVNAISGVPRLDLFVNGYYDGANWNSDDTTQPIVGMSMIPGGTVLQVRHYPAGANPRTSAAVTDLFIAPTGKVGIGTTNPQYLLSVKGIVGAQDVIVTNTGWSDYVFRPGYHLRPLSEINAYIQAHHHLPDIPTEAEVKEKGVSVSEMQAKLLAKIEELTLHLIQQARANQELRERVGRLEKGGAAGTTPTPAQ
jgi:hypothetical protein